MLVAVLGSVFSIVPTFVYLADDLEFVGYHKQFTLKLDTLGMFNVPIVPEE